MEHLAAQKSQNIWRKWQRKQQDRSQTESEKISDGTKDRSRIA